jgi:hypothetical protein
MDSALGAHAVRHNILQFIVSVYQAQLPHIEQRLTDAIAVAQQQKARLQKELDSAAASASLPSQLRLAVSNYTLRFNALVSSLLRGSTEGSKTDLGQTLAQEAQAIQDLGLCPPCSSAMDATPFADCHLYGGAQVDRALNHFRSAAAAAAEHMASFEASPDSISRILPDGCDAISAASQIAQRQVRTALLPLVDQLCSQISHVFHRIALLCEHLLQSSSVAVRYSYAPKTVSELFSEMVEARVASFRAACQEEFSTPTKLWDMPSLALDGNVTDVYKLACSIHSRLATRTIESIAARFYGSLLQGFVTTVPLEMHATLMALEDKQLLKFFQVSALEENLKVHSLLLQQQIEELSTKKSAIKTIVL